ncbi:hypothetical protein [Methylobacterium sp. Leaf93]|nr:hypothetical protein [Methylobacterium sp. Leaf93]
MFTKPLITATPMNAVRQLANAEMISADSRPLATAAPAVAFDYQV